MQRSHCNCPVVNLQRITARLDQDTLPIDKILQAGAEVTSHLQTMLNCERCITAQRITNMILKVTPRLVSFYEAAFANAAAGQTAAVTVPPASDGRFQPTTFPLPHHGESTLAEAFQGVSGCRSIIQDMKLGKLSIIGPEARLLVEVVLVDACMDLNEKLQEWKLVVDEQWEAAEEQYDQAICHCLDRLAKLIGLLRFDGLAGERSR